MMRISMSAVALALLAGSVIAGPALAQTTPAPADSAPAMTAPASPAAPAAKKPVTHHRVSLQQHFNAANTTHDGHLTKDQATAAKWNWVTKNFASMDTGKKGYVTVDDLKAYSTAQHAAHKKPVAPAAPATAAPATNS